MSEQAELLYQDALMAIETGNPQKAIDLLKQTVEEDPERVDAWVELAKLLEDKDEKRIALTTILQLEPDNAFAKSELAATEVPEKTKRDAEEFVPGISRREIRLVGIGLGIFTLVVCGIVFSIVSASNAQKAAQRAQVEQEYNNQTATYDAINAAATQAAIEATEEALNQTATLLAAVSATPTVTATRLFALPTEAPTDTVVTPTKVSLRVLELPPAGFGGRIYAWGGRAPGNDFKNLLVYPLSDQGNSTRVNEDRVQFPTTDTGGQSMVYMQSISGGSVLFRMNLQNPTAGGEILNLLFTTQRLTFPKYPRLSADGTKMVFIATSPENTATVYLVDFATRNTLRLTSDTANYTSAAIAPSGTIVVAAKTDATGTDLVAIDAAAPDAGFPQTSLTNDGDALIEAFPSFAPDGSSVVYTATTAGRPDQGDLYLLQIAGNQAAGNVPIMTVDGDDTYAVFDPTGLFVAFASNRVQGVYNIFVYDVNSRQTYQLTADSDPVIPGGWTN